MRVRSSSASCASLSSAVNRENICFASVRIPDATDRAVRLQSLLLSSHNCLTSNQLIPALLTARSNASAVGTAATLVACIFEGRSTLCAGRRVGTAIKHASHRALHRAVQRSPRSTPEIAHFSIAVASIELRRLERIFAQKIGKRIDEIRTWILPFPMPLRSAHRAETTTCRSQALELILTRHAPAWQSFGERKNQ